jgi:hypothetical protein
VGGNATGGVSGSGGVANSGGGTVTATGGRIGTGGSTWKQCFAGDKMPVNPGLRVDPEATGYTTAIDTGGYATMLLGSNRPSCITDAVAKRDLAQLDTKLRTVVELVGFPAFANRTKGYFLNWVILNSERTCDPGLVFAASSWPPHATETNRSLVGG